MSDFVIVEPMCCKFVCVVLCIFDLGELSTSFHFLHIASLRFDVYILDTEICPQKDVLVPFCRQ